MKKTYYLLLFVLFVSVAAKAQSGWVTQKMDDKFSVKFPSEPKLKTNNGINIYTYKGKDSIAYIANLVDFKVVANLDSATINAMKDSPMFIDQIKSGMVGSMPNFTLGDPVIGKWKAYTTYTIEGTGNTKKDKILIYMILIGTKMYTLSCLIPPNLATKNNEVFFNSVQLLK